MTNVSKRMELAEDSCSFRLQFAASRKEQGRTQRQDRPTLKGVIAEAGQQIAVAAGSNKVVAIAYGSRVSDRESASLRPQCSLNSNQQ